MFLSVCFILAKQTNHSALKAWIEIDRGQDKTTLYEDKDTIDVSITRTIGHTTSTITSHLKAAGVYSEPPREMWYYIPRRQHNRERGSQLTGQNSSTTNFDASKGLDRAATPPLPHLSEISGSDQDYSQQSGSAVSAEASLQYTSPTTSAIRDFFNQQAGSASDAQPPPQPVSSAQTFVGLSEQQASDGQRTPSLSSPPHTLLGLSDEQSEPASDEDRSPLSLSAATTLTANSFSEQQSGSASDNHRSLSSATLTTGSFCGTESDGQLSPLSPTHTLA